MGNGTLHKRRDERRNAMMGEGWGGESRNEIEVRENAVLVGLKTGCIVRTVQEELVMRT